MVCLYALATGEIDEVWLVPTHRHAFAKRLVPFEHRLAMCERLVEGLANARVDAIERELGGEESRTLDTLVALGERHPGHSFRLVVGTDILSETDAWHRWDEILRLAPVLVVPRPLPGASPDGFTLPDISSSAVRELLSRGENAAPLVPAPVMDYIATQGLYA